MADKPMDVYLNDHLSGAMLGSDLAEQIQDMSEGTPLHAVMDSLASQIEEDRQSLMDLMDRMGASQNPVKQATSWVTEKATRVKFTGISSGEPELGTFLAVEALTLGVEGKVSMWKAFKAIQDEYAALAETNLDELLERAQAQHDTLERERIAAGKRALAKQEAAGTDA
jgi:hypothetical protein